LRDAATVERKVCDSGSFHRNDAIGVMVLPPVWTRKEKRVLSEGALTKDRRKAAYLSSQVMPRPPTP
jgi:hypothetical protein